jgi:predicted outer membrane protein
MLRRIPRILRHAVIGAVLLAVSVSVYQSWSAGTVGTAGWTNTQWGPLGPADRDLIVKVRLAGLWEGPISQQAQQMATSEDVRQVGVNLAREHADLDEQVRSAADKLGVILPSGPNAQQIAWMDEISSQTGSDYDRVYIQRVREAHAQILPVIAEVRSTTQNSMVRDFAETGAEFVTRHQQYLESTGLVDFAALPHTGPGLFGGGTDMKDLLVPFLVFAAALLAAIALFWGLRTRPAPGGGGSRKERVTVPSTMSAASAPSAPRLPELTPVAALPAPRSVTLDDATGPIPVISDVGMPMDTGSQRWSAGVSDSGRYGRVPTYDSSGAMTDSGSHRAATTNTGSYRATDTGSQPAFTDTGSHRAVSNSGSHRMPRSRRARHSTRR